MRSRRHKLEVSTFPFLAVLLCAMGSLLLVLLIIDQRAKLAAKAKAQQTADQRAAERAEKARLAGAARMAEWERVNRRARAEWQRKADALGARLSAEKKSLEGELGAVQSRLAEAALQLRAEQENLQRLVQQANTERDLAGAQERALVEARAKATVAAGRLTAAEKERSRMTADLNRLEEVLKELRAARAHEVETYSVVPYKGKHGESRRPIYVECGGSALIFHPERVAVPAGVGAAVGDEVSRRLAHHKQVMSSAPPGSDPRPYVLALVRPDGIESYYLLQAVLRQAGIDFGYELIDAGWDLDFPNEEPPPGLPSPPRSGARAGPNPVAGRRIGVDGVSGKSGPGGPGVGGTGPGGTGAGIGPVVGIGTGVGPGTVPGSGVGIGPIAGSAPGVGIGPGTGGPGPVGPGGPIRPHTNAAGTLPTIPIGEGGGGGGVSGGTGPGGTSPVGPALGPPRLLGGALSGGGDGPSLFAPGGEGGQRAGGGAPGGPLPATAGGGQSAGAGASSVGPSGGPPSGAPSGAGTAGPGQGPATGGKGLGREGEQAVPPPQPGEARPGPGALGLPTAGPYTSATAGPPMEGQRPLAQGPPPPPPAAGQERPAPGSSRGAGSPGGGGGPADPLARFAPPAPPLPVKRPPERLRLARIADVRELVVYLECRRDGVILHRHPKPDWFPQEALTHSPQYNRLRQAVKGHIQNGQARRPAGEPPLRVEVFYLIHRDGARTAHDAQDALQSLRLPERQHALQPEDDVSAIVAGR